MKYCSSCGSEVEHLIPDGDNRHRHVCTECGVIHYHNHRVVAGCIIEHENKILLCKRAIEPRYGLWTLPAGFLENGETVEAGAARETMEEASANVDIQALYTLFTLTHIDQVYMIFRARLRSPEYGPGAESLEVLLLDETEIPWDQLAFPVMDKTLRLYLEDRRRGSFGVHIGEMNTIVDDNGRRVITRMLDSNDQA